MTFTPQLVAGVAQLLEDAGVGEWRPDGTPAAPGLTPIMLAALPAAPDRAIALTPYPAADDPALSDSTIGVQVRTRGTRNPLDVLELADAVFDVLHGLHDVTIGGVAVQWVRRASGTSLGADSNGRWEHSDNYYLDTHRPAPHRY